MPEPQTLPESSPGQQEDLSLAGYGGFGAAAIASMELQQAERAGASQGQPPPYQAPPVSPPLTGEQPQQEWVAPWDMPRLTPQGLPPAGEPQPAPGQHASQSRSMPQDQPQGQPPVDGTGQRPSEAVPYARFQEVNTRLQQAQEEARLLRGQQEAADRAHQAGFRSPLEYQQADQEAKRLGFPGIEQYQTTQRNLKQQQQYAQNLDQQIRQRAQQIAESTNFQVDVQSILPTLEPMRQEMLAQHAQSLATRSMYDEMQRTQQFTTSTLRENALGNVRQQFSALGVQMNPAFEQHLRSLDPASILEVGGAQVNWLQSALTNERGRYALGQQQSKQQIPPMGTGGAPPAPAMPPQQQQRPPQPAGFDPAYSSFADAMIGGVGNLEQIQRDWERAHGAQLPR